MYDGVDLTGLFGTFEEIIGKDLLVEFLSVEDVGADELNELLTDVAACSCKSLGFLVAVIDGDAELIPQDVADVTLSAADASRNSYP